MDGGTIVPNYAAVNLHCVCRFEGCEEPISRWGKATGGVRVTWEPGSIEAKLVNLRDRLKMSIWVYMRLPPDEIKTHSCLVCNGTRGDLQAMVDHLIYEKDRLLGDLVKLLDARVNTLGKT
jgi:hypothetical protein